MKTMLSRFEFQLLLFFLALAAFLKPILLPPPKHTPLGVMLSYFLPWAALIALLFLMARARPPASGDKDAAEDATNRASAPEEAQR